MDLTHTSIVAFRECPRKFWWSYVRKLAPMDSGEALTLGGLYHEGMAELLKADLPSALRVVDAFDSLAMTPEDKGILTFHAAGLLEAHARKLQTVKWTPIQIEQTFRILLGRFEFVGKIDAIVRDEQGLLWVVEHKTTSRLDGDYMEQIPSDGQVLRYIWAARELGHNVAGCIYTIAPKSALRGRANEAPNKLAKRIRVDAAAKEVTHLVVRPGVGDVERCMDSTVETLEAIRRADKAKQWYRHENACNSKWGLCKFYRICQREWSSTYTEATPVGFREKTSEHEELAE